MCFVANIYKLKYFHKSHFVAISDNWQPCIVYVDQLGSRALWI